MTVTVTTAEGYVFDNMNIDEDEYITTSTYDFELGNGAPEITIFFTSDDNNNSSGGNNSG